MTNGSRSCYIAPARTAQETSLLLRRFSVVTYTEHFPEPFLSSGSLMAFSRHATVCYSLRQRDTDGYSFVGVIQMRSTSSQTLHPAGLSTCVFIQATMGYRLCMLHTLPDRSAESIASTQIRFIQNATIWLYDMYSIWANFLYIDQSTQTSHPAHPVTPEGRVPSHTKHLL
jgi:hypothetical protein